MKISEEFIDQAIRFDGLLPEDKGEYGSRANTIKRGWQAIESAFQDINGWEARELSDGFPCLMPIGADDRFSSYIYVASNENYVPVLTAAICTDIDYEWGEPWYSNYQTYNAKDLIPLLIAFGV
jgi:hypothetical protein